MHAYAEPFKLGGGSRHLAKNLKRACSPPAGGERPGSNIYRAYRFTKTIKIIRNVYIFSVTHVK